MRQRDVHGLERRPREGEANHLRQHRLKRCGLGVEAGELGCVDRGGDFVELGVGEDGFVVAGFLRLPSLPGNVGEVPRRGGRVGRYIITRVRSRSRDPSVGVANNSAAMQVRL